MKTLHRISILVAVIFTQTPAQAHGGENLLKELKKRDNAIKGAQSEFVNSHSDVERMEHLNTQVEALNHKILTLRNLMAKEYPYVKE
ncbi:hypothetical protein, partial [Shewanella sp.]